MGRETFHTRPDKSHLVIVDSESEAEAMLTLKDLDGKPFPVSPDTQLNTRTGTVLIPNEICPDGFSWSDCSPELIELIQTNMISLMCPALPLILVAVTNIQ